MTKENLPTFHKWGLKVLEHKRAIIIALLVFGGFKVLNASLSRYFSVIEPCDQPCQDAMSCDQLELTLEIAPTEIELGEPYYLWYRARLKNRSCRRLEGVSVAGFIDSEKLSKAESNLWVSVIGPDGQEVKRHPIPESDGGIAWDYGSTKGVALSTEGTIYPYQPNVKGIEQLWQSRKMGKWSFVSLAPGETLETITPILRPHRIAATSIRSEDGGIGHGYRRLPVENPPKFPSPPEGFNYLDRYSFDRPGTYTIRAGFTDEIYVYPIYSRWDSISPWLQSIFRTAQPALWKSKAREVNLVASPAIIEVTR